jgi:hypothetical protein
MIKYRNMKNGESIGPSNQSFDSKQPYSKSFSSMSDSILLQRVLRDPLIHNNAIFFSYKKW